jgi:hypothetical protein
VTGRSASRTALGTAFMRAAGFSHVAFLSPQDAEARYYANRPRDIPPPRGTTIAAAIR